MQAYASNHFEEVITVPKQGIRLKYEKMAYYDYNVQPLISPGVLAKRVKVLAKKLSEDYSGDIYAAVVLKGSMFFFSDLMREFYKISSREIIFEGLMVRSYKKNQSTGKVNVKIDLNSLKTKEILIIDDIIDTGLTLLSLKKKLLEVSGITTIKTCCLLDKPASRIIGVNADYTGFIIPELFVVGYGLDYEQKYRGLPYVGFLTQILQ
jgi:hypoxanthine phosphoribosyltransferase